MQDLSKPRKIALTFTPAVVFRQAGSEKTFTPDKHYWLKTGRSYIGIMDGETGIVRIESAWWFHFKQNTYDRIIGLAKRMKKIVNQIDPKKGGE